MRTSQKTQISAFEDRYDARVSHENKINLIMQLQEPLRGALLFAFTQSRSGMRPIIGLPALYNQASEEEKKDIISSLKKHPLKDVFNSVSSGKSVIAMEDGSTSPVLQGNGILLSNGRAVAFVHLSDHVEITSVTEDWWSFNKADVEALVHAAGARNVRWLFNESTSHNRLGRWAITHDGPRLLAGNGSTDILMAGRPLTLFFDDRMRSVVSDDVINLSSRGERISFLTDMDLTQVDLTCRTLHIDDIRVKLSSPDILSLTANNAVVNMERVSENCEQIRLSHTNFVAHNAIPGDTYVSAYLSSVKDGGVFRAEKPALTSPAPR